MAGHSTKLSILHCQRPCKTWGKKIPTMAENLQTCNSHGHHFIWDDHISVFSIQIQFLGDHAATHDNKQHRSMCAHVQVQAHTHTYIHVHTVYISI
jgi:hypothetical protein